MRSQLIQVTTSVRWLRQWKRCLHVPFEKWEVLLSKVKVKSHLKTIDSLSCYRKLLLIIYFDKAKVRPKEFCVCITKSYFNKSLIMAWMHSSSSLRHPRVKTTAELCLSDHVNAYSYALNVIANKTNIFVDYWTNRDQRPLLSAEWKLLTNIDTDKLTSVSWGRISYTRNTWVLSADKVRERL